MSYKGKYKEMTVGSIIKDSRSNCNYIVINMDTEKRKWQGLSYHGGRFFLSLPSLSIDDPEYSVIGYFELENLKSELYS